ncbi:MAG: hypothetical protein R2792_01355 [Saprospiraceae bacterium]
MKTCSIAGATSGSGRPDNEWAVSKAHRVHQPCYLERACKKRPSASRNITQYRLDSRLLTSAYKRKRCGRVVDVRQRQCFKAFCLGSRHQCSGDSVP